MKIYVKDASGAERRIVIPDAIITTSYNFETENDLILVYDQSNLAVKSTIELADGVQVTITKN